MKSPGLGPRAGWTPDTRPEGTRASALWGKRTGALARLAVLVFALALCAPMTALAASKTSRSFSLKSLPAAFVAPTLLQAAQANPDTQYQVIVSGSTNPLCGDVLALVQRALDYYHDQGKIQAEYSVIDGVSAKLSGRQIAFLAKLPCINVIEDIVISDVSGANAAAATVDRAWRQSADIGSPASGGATPTIAIVDTGVDSSLADFGGRVLTQVDFTGKPETDKDGRGHGTMVAAVAAGSSAGHEGAAPTAKLVSLKVFDKNGKGKLSDAIAAADWIYQHKAEYNIKVANFSLNSSKQSSFLNDPLDQAVEKLWLGGVSVVAASGNYGEDKKASGVLSAPANDPFVITVGASDTNGTATPADDFAAPWSAYGYTLDGFAKPELGAPGRQLVVPTSSGSTMKGEHPERMLENGYMWISGTSFAAPVVAGVAANVLAAHPDWTPDQVKGALLVSAKAYSPAAAPRSLGVGVVDGAAAAAVQNPPNPNAALNPFVAADAATGLPVFQAASWATAAAANASWATASWATASWATASWATASWATASWATASWATASWATASWATASWATASWASASWATAANVNASWFS